MGRLKKIFPVMIFILMMIISSCASAPPKTGYVSYNKQLQEEKEQEAFLTRAIIGFVGFLAGGAIGVLSGEEDNYLTQTITGALVGAAVGYGAGYIISETAQKSGGDEIKKPPDEKVDEYFDEYEKIQLMP